ncbi:hypothetical protein GA0115237_111993 [Streptomyces sp. ScaeMP-6W]|nr:hypothetical protein GA0115237_111993 [Streptomyces sp. ScaeMP-6W]
MLLQYRNDRSQNEIVVAVPEIGSVPTLSRYENNKVELKPEKVFALLSFYGAPERDIEEALDCLARAKQVPVWSPPAGTSEAFRVLYAIEARAKVIRVYHESTVPGMLQTRAYAKALMEEFSRAPRDESLRQRHQADLDERLEFRMRRQALLDGSRGVRFEALIAEAALLTQRGGRAVQREQLRHLYAIAENRAEIHLRVLPGDAPRAGSALHNAMTLIKPHDDDKGRTLYLESRNRGGELITEGSELEAYCQSMDELWQDVGTKDETLKLIQRYIDKLCD